MGKFVSIRKELNAYARELTGEKWPYHYRQNHDFIDIERQTKLGKLKDSTITISVYADKKPKVEKTTRWYKREVAGRIGILTETKQQQETLNLTDLTENDLKIVSKVKSIMQQG